MEILSWTEATPEMKIMKIKLITILILTSLIVAGCVLGVPKEKNVGPEPAEQAVEEIDTSDWATYRNEELGVEFKHPEEWDLKEYKYQDRPHSTVVLTNQNFEEPYGSYGDIRVSITVDITNLSLEQWFDEEIFYNKKNLENKIDIMNKELGEGYFSRDDYFLKESSFNLRDVTGLLRYVKFLKPISLEGYAYTDKIYTFKVDDRVYTFYASSPTNQDSDKLIEVFDRLINTLLFI